MNLRAEYRVGPELKFLGNLDMMHLMERALRRARIPYALSEGFNPHIRLSMGTVLPVGLWSEKEYFDLELTQEVEPGQFVQDLNRVLPEFIQINTCQEAAGQPSLMKSINAACYVFVCSDPGDISIEEIWNSTTLPVKSRGKKKDVIKDLRPGLFRLELEKTDNVQICTWVSTGEPLNIRYDEIMDLFASRGLTRSRIKDVYRRGNYIKKEDKFYSPLDCLQ